jgi:hypothetical protein
MELTGRGLLERPMRLAIDHDAAGSADPLPAIMREGNGIVTLLGESLIDYIEHLEERHVGAHTFSRVGDDLSFGVRSGLSPDVQCETHYL